MLDSLRLRVCQLSHAGSLLADLPSAVPHDGLDQGVGEVDVQQFGPDVDVNARVGVVLADAELLPRHADHPVRPDPAPHASPSRRSWATTAELVAATAEAPSTS